jgi:hypothetical protein
MVDSKLVRMALKGFRKEWTPFIKRTVARETLPDWSRLWDDFIQEELRDEKLNWCKSKVDDENVALNKGKFKKFVDGESTSRHGKDMSKAKCYAWCKFGHYAGQCPNKKGGNKTQPDVVALEKAQMGEFAKKFK